MHKTLRYIFLLITLVLIGSCTTVEKDPMTYFGGKIINPKSEFVLLFNQDKLVDSLFLDQDDKFIGKYKEFKEGFYLFKHGNEFQHVYIEPQDSIKIRLNTWDFDETLVFSGQGADKNNILIDWFLEEEKEDKKFYSYYGLSPNLFKIKMDSLLGLRRQKIDLFKSRNENLPESYLNVLEIIVNYPIYTRHEAYPRRNRHYNKTKEYPVTSENFYDFRKKIDLNIDSLKYLGQYSNYIAYRLYNTVNAKGLSSRSDGFTESLLTAINKNITNEKLKNIFLYEMLVKDFLDRSSCGLDKKSFHKYFKLSSDIEDKKQVQRIINDIKNLHGGKPLLDFKITDYLKTKRSIQKITKNKNSVISFWNPKYMSIPHLKDRVAYLTKRFPKLNFIFVKISDIKSDYVHGIDIKNQYYLEPSSDANLFLTSKLPRTLLVNKKGLIINGYANINSYLFNKQLKHLQKQ
jgi:hypothetical protein